MFELQPPNWLAAVVFVVVGLVFVAALKAHVSGRAVWRYDPTAAWLRAFAYFSFAWAFAMATGTVPTIIENAWTLTGQVDQVGWWLFTGVCIAIIFIGYWIIWPIDTRPHGRRVVVPDTVLFGVVWGISEGLGFASVWVLSTRVWQAPFGDGAVAGIGAYATTVIVLSVFVGAWHAMYWDIHIAPEHNVIDANMKKVLLVHTPNVVITTAYLAVYENLGIYVLLQAFALLASALAMPFPSFREPLPDDPTGPLLGEETDDLTDLTGRSAVIVGGTTWLGRDVAERLASLGARVVILGPDVNALRETVATVTGRTGAIVDGVVVELTDVGSVDSAADHVLNLVPDIDVLFVAATELNVVSAQSVAHNHLGPELLCDVLTPSVVDAGGRIVVVGSDVHYQVKRPVDDDFTRAATWTAKGEGKSLSAGLEQYGVASLLSVTAAMERADTVAGTGATVNVVQPGGAIAELVDGSGRPSAKSGGFVGWILETTRARRRAVDACVYACASPELANVNGWYLKDRRPIRPSLLAQDEQFQVAVRNWTDVSVASHF